MPPMEMQGPFCQSCGMPLVKAEDFGTDQSGFHVNDYCRHCFANGGFTHPDATMQEMLDVCVDIMAKQGFMAEDAARDLMTETLPRLKRWRVPVGV